MTTATEKMPTLKLSEIIYDDGQVLLADGCTVGRLRRHGHQIVRAVNAHDSLVEAVNKAIGFIESTTGKKHHGEILEELISALAKAECK